MQNTKQRLLCNVANKFSDWTNLKGLMAIKFKHLQKSHLQKYFLEFFGKRCMKFEELQTKCVHLYYFYKLILLFYWQC